MKKSLVIKLAGVAAAAVAIVAVSGCSIISGMASVTRNALQGAAETARDNAQVVGEEVADTFREARYDREIAYEEAGKVSEEARSESGETVREAAALPEENARNLVEGIVQEASKWTDVDIENYAEAAEGYGWGGVTKAIEDSVLEGYGKSYDDSLKKYEQYGLELDNGTNEWYFGTKPVTGFCDPSGFTMTNGYLKGVGAYIVADRDANGNVTGIREVDTTEFSRIAGLTDNTTVEQDAATWGAKVYNEDITVKGMTQEQLYNTEFQLKVKYRGQAALVQCNDYAFMFDNDEKLTLSSFCASDTNNFGVKVLANLNIADEIDINKLNIEKINDMLLEMLKTGKYNSAAQVEAAAKTLVANHYGISEANLIAKSSELY